MESVPSGTTERLAAETVFLPSLPLETEFQQVGFNWTAYFESTPPEVGDDAELRRLRVAIVGELETILVARAAALRARHLQAVLADWRGLQPSDSQSE